MAIPMMTLNLTFDLRVKFICENFVISHLLQQLRHRYVLLTYRKPYMAIPLVTLNLTFDLRIKVICENVVISRLLLQLRPGYVLMTYSK
jgi:hypothetical protein